MKILSKFLFFSNFIYNNLETLHKSVTFPDIRQPHIKDLRELLSRYNWAAVINTRAVDGPEFFGPARFN